MYYNTHTKHMHTNIYIYICIRLGLIGRHIPCPVSLVVNIFNMMIVLQYLKSLKDKTKIPMISTMMLGTHFQEFGNLLFSLHLGVHVGKTLWYSFWYYYETVSQQTAKDTSKHDKLDVGSPLGYSHTRRTIGNWVKQGPRQMPLLGKSTSITCIMLNDHWYICVCVCV